jgi:Na+-exporting ATPase
MVVRAAWVPSRGTIHVGESSEPFNPTVGDLTFSKLSPADSNASSDANSEKKEKGASAALRPASTTRDQLKQDGGEAFETLLNIASMCNVAKVWLKDGEGWTARGDPTECAIQTFAHRFEHGREKLTEGDSPQWSALFSSFLTCPVPSSSSYRPY